MQIAVGGGTGRPLFGVIIVGLAAMVAGQTWVWRRDVVDPPWPLIRARTNAGRLGAVLWGVAILALAIVGFFQQQ